MTTGLRETVLTVINRVERKLGLNASSAVTSTKKSRELLDMLNEVMDEIADSGDWQEYIREVNVTAISSTAVYEVQVSGLVKNVNEIVYGSATSPLIWQDLATLRQLNRIGNYGTPRQVAIEGVNVSSGNPNFRVAPIPTDVSGKTFNVLYFQKPFIYSTTNGALVIPFPANLVVQSLYAKALLSESGGNPTREFQTAYTEALRMRKEANNRFNADVGNSVYFQPRGG
jgi:hypothetical protein